MTTSTPDKASTLCVLAKFCIICLIYLPCIFTITTLFSNGKTDIISAVEISPAGIEVLIPPKLVTAISVFSVSPFFSRYLSAVDLIASAVKFESGLSGLCAATVGVLGPVEATVAGAPANLGGPKPRAVLAAMAADAGHVVSSTQLAEAVWGEDHDVARPEHTLQTYVSSLRKALGAYSGQITTLRGTGYRFDG